MHRNTGLKPCSKLHQTTTPVNVTKQYSEHAVCMNQIECDAVVYVPHVTVMFVNRKCTSPHK